MFHQNLFAGMFGGSGSDPFAASPYAADPRMDPRAPLPKEPVGNLGGTAYLSRETKLDALLQEMQDAQKRRQMMTLAAMVGNMGQAPQPAPVLSQVAPIGAGQPGVARSGGPNPGQQLQAMLGKAGGIGRIPGTSSAPLGYPGGVPGAAAGAGASPANLLQQLAMKRRGPQGSVARSPYAGMAGRGY